MKKRVLIFAIILVICVISLTQIIYIFYPKKINVAKIKVEQNEESITNGEYLAKSVAACIDCHSPKNYNLTENSIYNDSLFAGSNTEFTEQFGFPGNYYAPNLTPYNLKTWSDGEILRAITTGISKDGHALFPVMPYHKYGKLEVKDIYDIIAYLRSLPEIKKDLPVSKSFFPMNLIIRTFPKEGNFELTRNSANSIERGKYFVTMAACADCHTKTDKGKPIEGFEFAGGNEFESPMGNFIAANITPDTETGIGNWSRETFITRFKQGSEGSFKNSSIMPWVSYSSMNKEELSDIYDYLMSLKPVKNKISTNINNQ
ncbi:Alcohol dehydrogenase (quinone), cytochrome c subunit [Flavobacteriales bacterium]|nr:MAG: c-type cytochrome [Vicingaceae bacterium]CAG0965046.1 Alcohol dehydrogenase (quinone), cytochrome c subunit [Flavobacteriales bacterium]